MAAKLSPSRHLRIGRSKARLGLFARVAIKKRQFIVRYSGRKIRTEAADELDTRYLFEVNARWTIDGSNRRNRARAGSMQGGAKDQHDLPARRSRCRSRPLAAPTSSSTSQPRMSNSTRAGVNWMRRVSSPSTMPMVSTSVLTRPGRPIAGSHDREQIAGGFLTPARHLRDLSTAV